MAKQQKEEQQKEEQQKEDYSGLLAAIRQMLKPEKPKSKPKFDWFIALSAATATAVVAIAYFKN